MPVIPEKWVIGLHERRGRYITLSNDNQRAIREGDTYDHGMVFSDRPLHIGEVFQLKIEELESKWAGSLVGIDKILRGLFPLLEVKLVANLSFSFIEGTIMLSCMQF